MKTTDAFPEPNYTQTPNRFFEMISDMTESELRVSLVMIRQTFGFHREGFKMGVHKLAVAAGLSDNGAKAGAEAAETRGTFRRSNPDAQTEAEWELVVGQPLTPSTIDPSGGQPLTPSPSTIDPQVPIKEKKKKSIKKNSISAELLGLDWKMLADQEITQEQLDKSIKEKEIADHFERTFGFNALPWATNAVWEKFFKFIVRVHETDPNMFTDYVAWRNGRGKYDAMSNKQIRMNPQVFMDTGYPEFEASKMYAKQEPKRKNAPVSQEEFRQGLAEWVQERSQQEAQNV